MAGMADGMIPGTTIAYGRGMIRSSGTIPTGTTLPGIIPMATIMDMAIPTAIITTIIPIIMLTEAVAGITLPTTAIQVPSTVMAVRMATLLVTGLWHVRHLV